MSEYLSPGIFIEDSPTPPLAITTSSSTGGFLGITERGKVGTPIYITSWNSYITNFALGMDSPFLADSDLAYSVYGFFQNGGKKCYIMRVASDTAKAATLLIPAVTPTLSLAAKDEGTWGNSLKVTIVANADNVGNFDLTVSLSDEVVEKFYNLSNTTSDPTYWINILETQSNYIKGTSGTLSAQAAQAFTTGADGVSDIDDADFTGALSTLDTLPDLNLLAIPGQTSTNITAALITYTEGRKNLFALIDAPKASSVSSVITLRKALSCNYGALLFQWIRVIDPLSVTGKLRDCPLSGHAMGVYARIISDRGFWKAPAGTEAQVRGAVEIVLNVTSEELDALNQAGVISVVSKTNYGIVIWGARSLHPDDSMRYVSDILLDVNIKKEVTNSTQIFVFEPNDPRTWVKIATVVQSYLDTLWRKGALMGSSAAEAYYVKCDEDLNTPAVIRQGRVICEVGYASKKPAEFIIFRFSHDLASN